MMRAAVSLLALAAMAGPALAQHSEGGVFVPPAGCRLEMTIQSASCRVQQVYRCKADDRGDQWSAIFRQGGGPTYLSRIDAETRWIYSLAPEIGEVERLQSERDPASFSELVATGRDDMDFTTVFEDGFTLRHVGFDELTGEEVVIDGVPLLVTRFELVATTADGTVVRVRKGNQYISPAHGRFYGGIETITNPEGETFQVDDTPRSFARPGQPGFGATTPQFGCDASMVSLTGPRDRGAL